MEYDPIKNILGKYISRNTLFRLLFYKTLGLIFLREWYVKGKIKSLYKSDKPENILDAGTGFGQYTYFLAKRFPISKIKSIDVKVEQIEDCKYFFSKKEIRNCEFVFGDLTKFDEQNQYDLILSVDVMEHIEDDIGVFKKFNNSLRNGGRVIINTPSNLGGSDAHSDEDDSFIGEHVRLGYSKEDICTKLEQSGFTIESFEYTYGKWGKLYWKLGIKYPMLLLNKSKFYFVILPFYYLITIWCTLLFMWLDVIEKGKTSGTGVLVVGLKS